MENKDIEIPFGAFDSELGSFEYTIPEGYEAEIKDGKVIVRKLESEDERIRKALVEMVHDTTGDSLWIDYNVHKEDALAWLEKKGEQKLEKCMYSKDNYTDEDRKVLCDGCDKICKLKQKPAWSEEDEEIWDKAKQIFPESLNMQSGYVTGYIDAFKHFSLKKEWSKDDMKVIKEIIFLLKHYNSNETLTTVYSIEDMINWLESLKDRVQPQPKQEWSKEDEKYTNIAVSALDSPSMDGWYCFNNVKSADVINWFKSLKDRYTWKLSDEQIKGIVCAIKTLQHQLNVGDKRLYSLNDALKKLKG